MTGVKSELMEEIRGMVSEEEIKSIHSMTVVVTSTLEIITEVKEQIS